MIAGKIVGAVLGLVVAGPFGALLGLVAGHFFDNGLGQAMGFDYQGQRVKLQRTFFETVFKVMGHLAKADGRISEEEVAQAEQLMTRLGLTPEHREEAIELFKAGAQDEFNLQQTIAEFIEQGGRSQNLPAMLLEFLFSIAMADGELHPAEKEVLSQVASYMGIGSRQFEQLLAMLTAQQKFHQGGFNNQGYQQSTSVNDLENAYKALGIDRDINDKDLKKAYRKLMSQHHPDKLIAQGVPEDMIRVATEKSQEIQAAYELVKQSRK